MEVSSEVCPTEKAVSAVHDVAWETERRTNSIANRPCLAAFVPLTG
jgi:hypothetical protein